MPRERRKQYNDGLTKQQRYVMRNRQKVYEANARRRKERREEQKAAANKAGLTDLRSETETPIQTSNISESSTSKSDEDSALYEEVQDFFKKWSKGLDDTILRVDLCWDMCHGWTNPTTLTGSKTERSLNRRADTARALLGKLRDVLRRFPPGSEQWEAAIDMLEWVSFKNGQVIRILSHDYPGSQNSHQDQTDAMANAN